MKKIIIASIIILAIAGILYLNVPSKSSEQLLLGENLLPSSSSNNSAGNSESSPATNLDNTTPTTVEKNGINSGELSQHSSSSDCWVVYKNKVYDITSFIPKHSGGAGPIARTCGTTNFESAFQRQHGTSKASLFMKVTTYKGEFVA